MIIFAGLEGSLNEDTAHITQTYPVRCQEHRVMEVITSNLGMLPCKL